jgi:hypothetical protein
MRSLVKDMGFSSDRPGKSLEGRKFKSRIAFWTLRPKEIGGGGIRPTGCGCGVWGGRGGGKGCVGGG